MSDKGLIDGDPPAVGADDDYQRELVMVIGTDQSSPNEPVAVGLSPHLFAEAARGALTAQRQLRDAALQMAHDGTAPFDQAFAVAEVFARLASSNGEPADRIALAAILFRRAAVFSPGEVVADYATAQALAQLDAAADAGDTQATALLERAAQEVEKPIFDLAQELRTLGATA